MKHILSLLLMAALPFVASAQVARADFNDKGDGEVDQYDVGAMANFILGKKDSDLLSEYVPVAPNSYEISNKDVAHVCGRWNGLTGPKDRTYNTTFNADGTCTTNDTVILPEGAVYYKYEPVHGRMLFYNAARDYVGFLNVIYVSQWAIYVNNPKSSKVYRLTFAK